LTAFGEVDLFIFIDGSDASITRPLSSFAVLPDGASAFNRADQR
jgi:hypothetical protein